MGQGPGGPRALEPKKKKETEKPLPDVSVSNSEDEGVDEDDSQLSPTMAETAGHENLSGDDSSVSDSEGKQDHSTMVMRIILKNPL